MMSTMRELTEADIDKVAGGLSDDPLSDLEVEVLSDMIEVDVDAHSGIDVNVKSPLLNLGIKLGG